ncbi:cytochrome C [Pararhodobacter marinus]|uniref:Cytochrome C n=1 Tax=Pararhodobacter marinus TaxID=2184063 RepID=A0A2U2C3W1_9RHOB|nr:cytochrome c [Pararhodobacter marinus]PWE26553.1 cytochrome C [Pararhodobacter marinus]
MASSERRIAERRRIAALSAAALPVVAGSVWLGGRWAEGRQVAQGRVLYDTHCASCHGADLRGQPGWQRPGADGRLPAPPHDASGHTWHHDDALLFRITRDGSAAVVGGGYESDMPGFGGLLSDGEIRAVLAFIRSTWPERERAYQREISRQAR